MDQRKSEDSEVPVSESYHSSETREHEFADDLDFVAISNVREGINYRWMARCWLRKPKAQQMEGRIEEDWRPVADPSMITHRRMLRIPHR